MILSILAILLFGLIDGILEGYGFDGRKSFERKFGVKKDSYFGSESWRRIYKGGEKKNGVKSRLYELIGAFDFYHNADDARKVLGIVSGIYVVKFLIIMPYWYSCFLYFAIVYVLSSITKHLGMKWIRS